jgi:predicted GNAT family acetyltransferase
VLGAPDVPAMLELVAATRPGPFGTGTHRLGTYLGIRHAGRLAAMAGERMHPPGFVEISAVATHPDFRGRGLALRLIRAVVAGIRARGEVPFLHVAAENTGAVRLYESAGFERRMDLSFRFLRAPGGAAGR